MQHSPIDDIKPELDYSFNVAEVTRFSYVLFLSTAIVIGGLFIGYSGLDVFLKHLKFFIFKLQYTIPLLLAGIVLHELLHALVYWLFLGFKQKSVTFGFNKKYLTPYIWMKKPVTVRLYKISVLTPLVVLGIIPLIYSMLTNNPLVGIYAWIFIFSSAADIYAFFKIRKLPPTLNVMDHPSRVGCYLIEKQRSI